MRGRLFGIVMLVGAAPALAQEPPVEVDQSAILRLGNLVQQVGSGPRAEEIDAFAAAMAPPASDADKWFISVVTTQGCSGCEVLKRDWAENKWLLALADPNDPKGSWAHYNVYDASDKSQAFRFENVKVSVYPTILVQPPRTGQYGDPATIVFQGAYANDPEKLARAITDAVRQYVARLQEATPTAAPTAQPMAPQAASPPVPLGFGADPPWTPAPRIDPWQPRPCPSPFDPTIPPMPTPFVSISWLALLRPLIMVAVVAGVAWLVYMIWVQRLAQQKEPPADQRSLDEILALLKKLPETPSPTPKT